MYFQDFKDYMGDTSLMNTYTKVKVEIKGEDASRLDALQSAIRGCQLQGNLSSADGAISSLAIEAELIGRYYLEMASAIRKLKAEHVVFSLFRDNK